jgi:histidinol phosphatase-like PHP family hydrolase
MLIDCHLHTTRYSPCSHLRPYDACALASQRGLDALVITEHQIQWNKKEIKELQQDFPELKLYSGVEVTLREGLDLVITKRQLHNYFHSAL